MYLYGFVHECSTLRGQKRVPDALEVELQGIVRHKAERSELDSVRAMHAPHHPPSPRELLFVLIMRLPPNLNNSRLSSPTQARPDSEGGETLQIEWEKEMHNQNIHWVMGPRAQRLSRFLACARVWFQHSSPS